MGEAFDADALLSLGRLLKAEGYSFVTPTPATCERVNARPDNRWAEDVRGVMGWSRVLRPGGRLDGLLDMLQAAHIAEPADGGWRSRLRASSTSEAMATALSSRPTRSRAVSKAFHASSTSSAECSLPPICR